MFERINLLTDIGENKIKNHDGSKKKRLDYKNSL